MYPLSLAQFEQDAAAYDAAVLASEAIDHFCSSTHWILPAYAGLQPGREPWIWRLDNGWAVFAMAERETGARVLEPFEAAWGLACPLIGGDPDALASDLARAILTDQDRWDIVIICGVSPEAPLYGALVSAMGSLFRVLRGPETPRYLADISGGVDGWLARRSPKLRATVRSSLRRAQALGVTFERADIAGLSGRDIERAAERLYARILDIESRSWKGMSDTGLAAPEMRDFYRAMLPRLIRDGTLRLLFMRHEGRDIAYNLGALFGDTYRGLQFSYDDAYRPCGPGNVIQHEQVARIAAEGILRYDLGSEAEYKRRWAEPGLQTVTLLIVR